MNDCIFAAILGNVAAKAVRVLLRCMGNVVLAVWQVDCAIIEVVIRNCVICQVAGR